MEEERKVVILNIDDILPNRFQPRIQFNEQAINELAESIKLHGVIQPIVVRKISDKYEIIAGERRYKASVMAGKTTIPAIVTDLDDKNSAEVALIENVQRQDLTPIEEAISYKKILDMGYINQEELGSKLGKKQSTIANKLRLLNLSDEVQEALMENKISERHARSLLKLNEQDQILMLNRIINERLTVRKTDEEIAKLQENNGGNQKEIEKGEIMNNDILRDFNIPTEPIINDEVNSVKDNEVKPQEIQESINPSYNFTNETVDSTNQNNNQVNPGFMDIDRIEKMAEDINKPEVKLPNVDLMFNPAPVSPVEQEKEEIKSDDEMQEVPQGGRFFNMFNFNEPEKDESFIEDVEDGQVNMDFGENLGTPSPLNPIIEPIHYEEKEEPLKEETPVNPFGESVSFIDDEDNKQNDVTPINDVKPVEPIQEVNPFNDTIQPFTLTDDGFSSEENVTNLTNNYENANIERPYMMNNDIKFDDEGEIEVKLPSYDEQTIKVDMKTVINTIRDCASQIEKYGYEVDTDEIDLNDTYEVTFKIKKND